MLEIPLQKSSFQEMTENPLPACEEYANADDVANRRLYQLHYAYYLYQNGLLRRGENEGWNKYFTKHKKEIFTLFEANNS